jgi:positive regulator of sigma E activity
MRSHCEAQIVAANPANVSLRIEQQRCQRCSGGCLRRLLGSADEQVVVLPREHFAVTGHELSRGRRVQITFPTPLLLALSSVVYLVPVIVMLLFAIGCSLLVPDSEALLLGALCLGLAVGLLGSNLLVRVLETVAKQSLVCNPVE